MKLGELKPGFGAVASEVDVASLTDAQWRALHAAFARGGGLLLVRGGGAAGSAQLSPSALKAFASRFGALEDNEKYYRMGMQRELHSAEHREILCVGNKLGERSMMIAVDAREPLLWHCDDSFRSPQPMGSCFYCVEPPADGGAATCFASGSAALRALPPAARAELRRLAAVHDYDHLNAVLRRGNPGRPPLSEEVRAATPPVLRPLVAMHPETQEEALYVPACHIAAVVSLDGGGGGGGGGGPVKLSEGLLRSAAAAAAAASGGGGGSGGSGAGDGGGFSGAESVVAPLLRLTTSDAFAYRHEWQRGDLVVWDNRCTLHAPTSFDDSCNTRLMWRITILGEQVSPSPDELQSQLHRTAQRTSANL